MSYYILPEGCTKEQWLLQHGLPLKTTTTYDQMPEGTIAVVLINNGMITRLQVCYSKGEFELLRQNDGRQKLWFLVTIYQVRELLPMIDTIIARGY